MFGTPGEQHSVPKRITNPDDFDESVIRRTVYDFYTQEEPVPTVRKQTNKTNKLHGLSPRANYTDRVTAACRRSDCQLLRIKGATWSA
jgi:hypothetical protein